MHLMLLCIGKVCGASQMAHQAAAYPGFCSYKRLGVFLLRMDGMLHVVYHRDTPSNSSNNNNLFTP